MNWLLLVVKYFPLVIQGVISIQGAMKGAPGATKKEVFMSVVKAGAAVGESVSDAHIAGISQMVDATVSALNATNFAGFGNSGLVPTAQTAAVGQ